MNDVSANITYGSYTVDIDSLSPANRKAIFARGWTHYMGNEQNAKLANWKQAEFVKEFTAQHKRAPTEAELASAKAKDKNYGIPDETLAAQFKQFQDAAYEKATSGEIGLRATSAIVLDPLEKIVNRLAKASAMTILAAHGLKWPKGDKVVTFANGTTRTADEMIANRIKLEGDKYTKQAKAELAAKAKAIESAKAQVGNATDDLGL